MITLAFSGNVHPTIELTLVPVQTEWYPQGGPGPTEYVVRCNGDKIGSVTQWGPQWRASLEANPIPHYGKPRRNAVHLDVCPENAVLFAFQDLTGIWFACQIRRPESGVR